MQNPTKVNASQESFRSASTDWLREAFIGLLAHELKGQLAGITQALDAIESYKLPDGAIKSEASDYFDFVKAITNNALNVYDNMLGMAQTGALISKELIEIAPFLHNCVAPFMINKGITGVDLSARIHITPGTKVEIDGIKTQQIICNLLHNAFKYCGTGTTIYFYVRIMGGNLKFHVTSYGMTIPREQHKAVFEPYQTLEKGKAGVGLGLYLCKKYSELLGGKISVHSRNGITKFNVSLPVTMKNQ
ncbi:sensor histidine kinase KdpD [Chitinophaga sp. Cy-1792]|uniref:sensor histidine kinase n=1 Tax=Chitinophaga sp. Cy-1792 TaxID=2608339 RepID=UPI00141DDFA4|nr:HAMP domain-containing sensor histidine kinase [Chitinophaga sp. Cy-1792]NIG53876.1 HAMP domain-containing histidine kinase [Chitinophaga sp. Cy-1792]